jgi:hypothetical protein
MVRTSTDSNKSGIPLVFKIMGVLMVIMILLVVMAVSFYRNCDNCKKFSSLAMDGFQEIQAAMVAPGTDEMRALGCTEAMALDMKKFEAFIDAFENDGESAEKKDPLLKTTMVFCKKDSALTPEGPECDDLVAAYISGAQPSEEDELAVVVQGQNSQSRYCGAVYSGTGEYLRELEE